ncbi:transporter [Halomonas elongata]|uniref:transporter n=1 Tax=Halomonas elongata TaxID=2746 RepID=UPI0040346AEC
MNNTKIPASTTLKTSLRALCYTGVLVLPATASAVNLNARDFVSAPVGTVVSASYLSNQHADEFHGADDDAYLNVNALAYRQLWFSDICGTLCTPQFVLPYLDVTAQAPGQPHDAGEDGFADPQIGGTLYVINDPETRTYSGLLTLVSLPLGEYDANRPGISAGANRWATHFAYNYTQGIGESWILEGNLEAQFYGSNDDYHGATLDQSPLYRLQAFASYDITPKTYGALRLIHGQGGELEIDGETISDTEQRYTRLGAELAYNVTPRDRILLALSHNIDTENAFHGSQSLLRFSHAW